MYISKLSETSSISVESLNAANFAKFKLPVTWGERQFLLDANPGYLPREYLIGRIAVNLTTVDADTSTSLMNVLIQQSELSGSENILSIRRRLLYAILGHNTTFGVENPIYSGRSGNDPIRGVPLRIAKNGVVWGVTQDLWRESISDSFNNPFNYIYKRFINCDEAERKVFVPTIAVFDMDKLSPCEGNRFDNTSFQAGEGLKSPIEALASLYYFDPDSFAFES